MKNSNVTCCEPIEPRMGWIKISLITYISRPTTSVPLKYYQEKVPLNYSGSWNIIRLNCCTYSKATVVATNKNKHIEAIVFLRQRFQGMNVLKLLNFRLLVNRPLYSRIDFVTLHSHDTTIRQLIKGDYLRCLMFVYITNVWFSSLTQWKRWIRWPPWQIPL